MDSKRKRTHKADVMISSTVADLPKHREAAIDAVWRRHLYPLAMEAKAAASKDALTFSLELVDEAEIYIGILGFRYGYIPNDPRNPDKCSVTELEYRRAKARGIPILWFVMDEKHPVTAGDADKFHEHVKARRKKLEAFRAEILHDYVVSFFVSETDLAGKIYQALSELIESGKVETEEPDETEGDLGLPKPPEPYIAHRYVLTRKFFGRTHELADIDMWAADKALTTLIVESIGGQGKSALTWEWFNAHAKDYDAALWWSFYESESSVTAFVRGALAYLSGRNPTEIAKLNADEALRSLLHELSKRRVLMVLDGIERIMVAYHRIDAARVDDDTIKDTAPETNKEASGDQLRACTDPRHGDLLRQLAAIAGVKILISTRLVPFDLQDPGGGLMIGVRHVHLNGLADDDAYDLITHLGVRGDKDALRDYLTLFGNHSLLIGVLAGRINDYRPAPGDFAQWLRGEGRTLRLHEVDLKQKRTNILKYALDGLKPELRRFLSQIAHFREAVAYTTLSAFNPYLPPPPTKMENPEDDWMWEYTEDKEKAEAKTRYEVYQAELAAHEAACLSTQPQFHAALGELEGRGLLQWDRASNTYDLHPVVRQYAFEDTSGDERKATYQRIRDHFDGLPPEKLDDVTELPQLGRSITIYRALIGAGLFDQASNFYRDRLQDILIYHIGAYHAIIELLTPLFVDGVDKPPALSDYEAQSARMTNLANAYSLVGQREKGKALRHANLKLDLEHEQAINLGVGLTNYANTLHADDALAASLRTCELARDLAAAAEDQDGLAKSHLWLLIAYRDIGAWGDADAAYQAFSAAPPSSRTKLWQSVAEKYYVETLTMRGLDASTALDRAEGLAKESRNSLMFMQIQRQRGEAALQRHEYAAALTHFENGRALAQKSGVNTRPYIGGVARARAGMGDRQAALALLAQGELDISAAEVYLMLGDTDQARAWGLKAYESAWADGEPYVWWWYLQRARAVLKAVGEPEPVLPKLTKSGTGKLYLEDEIRALIEKLKAEKK